MRKEMAVGKSGDEIVCDNGHVCGTLHADINDGDTIVLPASRKVQIHRSLWKYMSRLMTDRTAMSAKLAEQQ
jgi:hypothetical protein